VHTAAPSFRLDLAQICAPSRQGQEALHSHATRLASLELELLVRLDGVLTLGQVQAAMGAVSAEEFAAAFLALRDGGLLAVVEIDRLAAMFRADLQQLALASGDAEADAGVRSRRQSGYYVGIARPRAPRHRAPDHVLTAVVVEDEPTLARFVKSYLSFEGFQVRLAANRAEVVAEFNKRPLPDVVLLDVMLPDADGFEILAKLRAHPVLKDVPIIMCTGKATREAVLQGMAGGADGYVTKPFEADALMRAVRTVTGLEEVAAETAAHDPWRNRDALNVGRLR
jgi:two-component system OmpR family response regulator